MEIRGKALYFPPNFRFFHKLPARFEILVVAQGAQLKRATAFEIEIQGQRLVLQSQVPLKVGARYDLEKAGGLEFRIVAEKKTENNETKATEPQVQPHESGSRIDAPAISVLPHVRFAELLALKIFEEAGSLSATGNGKFSFSMPEFSLRGLFHSASGQYQLFVTGPAADTSMIEELNEMLSDLKVLHVRSVSESVFDHLAQGALDISI